MSIRWAQIGTEGGGISVRTTQVQKEVGCQSGGHK